MHPLICISVTAFESLQCISVAAFWSLHFGRLCFGRLSNHRELHGAFGGEGGPFLQLLPQPVI